MIKFETPYLGKVIIRFKHYLPKVVVPNQNNSLVSIVNGIKLIPGHTECILQIDCDQNNQPLYQFFGFADLHPSDNYKKETGRVLALNRAVEAMTESELFGDADSRAVMAGYYSR